MLRPRATSAERGAFFTTATRARFADRSPLC